MIHRVAGVCVAVVAVSGAAAWAQPKVEEKVLGPVLRDFQGHVISPRGVRLATVAAKGEGAVVFVDGVESPVFDGVLDSGFVDVSLPPEINDWRFLKVLRDADNLRTAQMVLFSDDGARYAFAGVSGADFVVIADGKEVFRTPSADFAGVSAMRFSPGGKHLCFALIPNQSGAGHGFRLVMDGKASDLCYLQPLPVFSPDGEHYAYVATDPENPEKTTLIVDGKPAAYEGVRPKFDAKGRVFSVKVDPETSKETLLLDGAPWFTGSRVQGVYRAPAGGMSAAAGYMGTQQVRLFIDGKFVAAAADVEDVFWSPDGAHYAALCATAQHTRFVVYDGKNGPELQNITDLTFSPDSSKLVYVGYMDGQHHVVLDNEGILQGAAAMSVKPFFYGPKHEVAFVQAQNLNDMAIVMGEQMMGGLTNVAGLAASPDGTRFAFAHGQPNYQSVVIGEMEYKGFVPAPFDVPMSNGMAPAPWFLFSPDGKHIARVVSSRESREAMGLMVDETLIRAKNTRVGRAYFTPDSRHLFYVVAEKPFHQVYLDGEPVAKYDMSPHSAWEVAQGAWEMEPDGTFVIMGPVGGEVKRLRITPGAGTSVETMMAKGKGR